MEHFLLTEYNGLLPFPITYSQTEPSSHPTTAQKLRDMRYKEIKYYWFHTLTKQTGNGTLWVITERHANLLIKFWNHSGGCTWKYSLEPFKTKQGGPTCPLCCGDADLSGTPGQITCFNCGYEGSPK